MMTYTKEQIIAMLASNDFAVERALLALYARQTADEQESESTRHNNGMGFNGRDAQFYSSLARFVQKSGRPEGFRLTQGMLGSLRKRNARGAMAIAKYAGQLVEVANAKAARAALAA